MVWTCFHCKHHSVEAVAKSDLGKWVSECRLNQVHGHGTGIIFCLEMAKNLPCCTTVAPCLITFFECFAKYTLNLSFEDSVFFYLLVTYKQKFFCYNDFCVVVPHITQNATGLPTDSGGNAMSLHLFLKKQQCSHYSPSICPSLSPVHSCSFHANTSISIITIYLSQDFVASCHNIHNFSIKQL